MLLFILKQIDDSYYQQFDFGAFILLRNIIHKVNTEGIFKNDVIDVVIEFI